MKKLITIAACSIVGIVLLIVVIESANRRTAALNAQADCVAAVARAHDYAGNPYGEDAWRLFGSQCS